MAATLVQRAGDARPVNHDAMYRQVRYMVDFWIVSWMEANSLTPATYGVIEEYGWPNAGADLAQWNLLGEAYLRYLDTKALPHLSWGAGRGWFTYLLGCWVNPAGPSGPINTTQPQARIYERYLGDARSGACVSGGESHAGLTSGEPNGGGLFSTANLGVYNSDWFYPSLADFQYLKGRGVSLARVMIRWERLQTTLGGALDATEIGRLQQVLADADSAGVKVIFCPWNLSRYWQGTDSTTRVRLVSTLLSTLQDVSYGRLGVLTASYFADFWQRMAHALKGYGALHGYSLDNEPGMADEFGTATGGNLVTIGTFDADVTGWNGYQSNTIAWDGTNQRTGGGCLKLTSVGGVPATIQQAASFVVTPSTQYQVGAWVKKAAAGTEQWTVQVDWSTSGGSFIQSDTASFPQSIAGTYVQMQGGVTSPSNAGKAQIKVHTVANSVAGTVNYIDDVSMATGPFNTGGKIVEGHTQAALTAIRTEDMTSEIWVPGFGQAPLHWHDYHPLPWITDPANKYRYAMHFYFDQIGHNAGSYADTYANELAAAVAAGF